MSTGSWKLVEKERLERGPRTRVVAGRNSRDLVRVGKTSGKSKRKGEYVYLPANFWATPHFKIGVLDPRTCRFSLAKNGSMDTTFALVPLPLEQEEGYKVLPGGQSQKQLAGLGLKKITESVNFYVRRGQGFGLRPGYYDWTIGTIRLDDGSSRDCFICDLLVAT